MLVIPIRQDKSSHYGDTTTYCYTGKLPDTRLKSGLRNFRLCAYSLEEFFGIPANAIEVRCILTKRAHPEAYKMNIKQLRYSWANTSHDEMFLDDHEAPGMYSDAATCFVRAIDQGYTHIRFDYKEDLS